MKKLIVLVYLILLFQSVEAQARRSQNTSSALNRAWNYSDLTLAAQGYFINAKEGEVFIKTKKEVVSIPLHELHWEDRKFVASHLKKIENLRLLRKKHALSEYELKEVKTYQSAIDFSWYTQALVIFVLASSCFLLAWSFKNILKQRKKLTIALVIMTTSLMASIGYQYKRSADDSKGNNMSLKISKQQLNKQRAFSKSFR